MFCCTNGEMVIGEVVGIELSNTAFQFENAGIAGFDDFYFVSNSLLEVGDTSLQGFDGFILGGIREKLYLCGAALIALPLSIIGADGA